MMDWRPECVGELRRLCAEGHSAGVMAGILHTTRNAVIGKAKRLGLKLKAPLVARKPQRLLSPKQPPQPPWKPPPPKSPPKPRADLPLQCSPCTVADLTDEVCHWPLWNGHEPFHEKRYCGAMTIAGQVYCLAHWRMAKQPKGAR